MKVTIDGTEYVPVKEEKEVEVLHLYCIEDYDDFLTKGKVYEFKNGGIRFDERESIWYADYKQFCQYNAGMAKRLLQSVRRNARVGEWVVVTSAEGSEGTYMKGHICEVVKAHHSGTYIKTVTELTHNCNVGWGTAFLHDEEYSVLEGYKPVYYNGKVLCVEGGELHTQYKVYSVVDGVLNSNSGGTFISTKFKTLEEINDCFTAQFVEFIGEQELW